MPNNIFEDIKKINEYGSEYWSARALAKAIVPRKKRYKTGYNAILYYFGHV